MKCLNFSFDRARSFARIYLHRKVRWRCAVHKSQNSCHHHWVCVWLISLAKFQCVNGEKFIDLLFTKNKKQNTPTREPYLKSCKILPRWTIYFSLHPFHLVARKKNIPKRNEFIYLLKCHFLAMSRCFHTQVFYLCFAIIELPSKRRKKAKKHIVYIYSE